MTRLQDLYDRAGQSPWLDNLKRSYLTSGRLAELVSSGVRGLTSNPTIMAKAIAGSEDYDELFSAALAGGHSVEEAYWDLVVADVSGALAVLRPCTMRAVAVTVSCRSRFPPASPTTPMARSSPHASCTSASTSRTCW